MPKQTPPNKEKSSKEEKKVKEEEIVEELSSSEEVTVEKEAKGEEESELEEPTDVISKGRESHFEEASTPGMKSVEDENEIATSTLSPRNDENGEESTAEEKNALEKVEKKEFLEERKKEIREGGFFDDLYKAERKDQKNNPLRKLFIETHFHPIYFAAILLSFALFLLGSWFAFENKLVNFSKPESTQTSEEQINLLVEETKTASDSAETVTGLKIRVLNGSGKKGQAGEVKTKLLEAGFEEVETGNSSDWDGEKTLLEYSKEVTAESIARIKKLLDANFENVIVEETEKLGSFDVVVTTGK